MTRTTGGEVKLWHDDVRPPPDSSWRWARTNEKAREVLLGYTVTECSLDHDLGGHEIEMPETQAEMTTEQFRNLGHYGGARETGYDLVNWMLDMDLVPPKVTVHSWNPPGAAAMAARLERFSDAVVVVEPFDPGR